MIEVTRLNDKKFVVNSDLIEFIEETPDTVITLTTGKKIVVSESMNEIVNAVINYRNKIILYPCNTENKSEV